jgi:hypothetical protein
MTGFLFGPEMPHPITDTGISKTFQEAKEFEQLEQSSDPAAWRRAC